MYLVICARLGFDSRVVSNSRDVPLHEFPCQLAGNVKARVDRCLACLNREMRCHSIASGYSCPCV